MSRSLSDVISSSWDNHVLFSLMLELTYACELNCSFCYNDRNKHGKMLTLEKYKDLLTEARGMGCLYLTLTGGEPTLYRDFMNLGGLARGLGYYIRIKTHGTFLTKESILQIKDVIDPAGLDVTIHGADEQTHDRMTQVPGSFSRLMSNLGEMKRREIKVQLRCPITRWNQTQIRSIHALGSDLGMQVVYTPEITGKDDGDHSPFELSPDYNGVVEFYRFAGEIDSEMTFADVESMDQNRSEIRSRYNCGAGTGSITVDPYGDVLPCVAWRKPIGNLWETTIKILWESSEELSRIREWNRRAELFRQEHLDDIGDLVFCPGRAMQECGTPIALYDDIIKLGKALREARSNIPFSRSAADREPESPTGE